jgi:phosphate-selective porin OprO/OprP
VAAQVQASGASTGPDGATNADPAGANANRSSATFASMIQGPGREPSIYPGSAAPVPSSATGIGGYEVGSDKSFQGYWGPDGPIWRTKNGDFSFHPRAVAQLDFVAMRNPPNNIVVPGGSGTLDSVEFRRLRMGADGTMWDIIDYVFEFDFALALQNVDPANTASPVTGLRSIGTVGGVPQTQAGNTAGVMQTSTTFLVFKQLPMFDNIRVGNQQSWLSLEHIESARFLDFMERSPIMDAFNGPNNNGYTPGISTYRTFLDMNVGLQLGVYKNNNYDSGFTYDIGNTNYSYGGRLICTPYYDLPSKGRYMVHLGIGGEWRTMQQQPTPNMDGTNIRIRSRGDIRTTASTLDPNFSDTGNFYANAQGLINPELAVVWGPWLLQAEWEDCIMQGAAVQKGGKSLGNVNFNGGYVALLYFLTGENREYNRVSGVFNRVVPYSNASWTRGGGFQRGAWQVGLRYDWLDLNSGAVSGGQNQDLTVGVNWFLNPNARFQFNYVASWINNAPGVTFPGTVGSLNGSRFVGEGVINTLGCRMDFNW